MLFEPEPDDAARRRTPAKRYGKATGLLYILGVAGVIVALIYLVGFLD